MNSPNALSNDLTESQRLLALVLLDMQNAAPAQASSSCTASNDGGGTSLSDPSFLQPGGLLQMAQNHQRIRYLLDLGQRQSFVEQQGACSRPCADGTTTNPAVGRPLPSQQAVPGWSNPQLASTLLRMLLTSTQTGALGTTGKLARTETTSLMTRHDGSVTESSTAGDAASSSSSLLSQATRLTGSISNSSFSRAPKNKDRRKYNHESFPVKLYRMIAETDNSIVSFNQAGNCFHIRDPVKLGPVLKTYFRHSQMTSLKRQLSMYNFRRVLQGQDKGGFYHALFRRDRPDLVKEIQREEKG